MLWCQNTSRKRHQFWHFWISEKAQLPPTIRIEQSILLTRSRINSPGCKFSKYLCLKRGQSSLILVLVLQSKGFASVSPPNPTSPLLIGFSLLIYLLGSRDTPGKYFRCHKCGKYGHRGRDCRLLYWSGSSQFPYYNSRLSYY